MKKQLALIGVVAVAFTSFSSAGVVNAWEVIEDEPRYDILNRDLTRDRGNDAGYSENEDDDATIISDNSIDSDFGIVNNQDVSYVHDVNWFDPPAGSYLSASLTIYAWGAVGDDDEVTLGESTFVGTIESANLFWDGGFTTTQFSSSDGDTLDLLLGGGQLQVDINKNADAGFWFFGWVPTDGLNAFSIYKSRLDVEYVAVPEPSALLLAVTAGVSGLLLLRRRRNA